MVNRLVSVGDDFTLPTAVKVANPNLPANLQPAALSATFVPKWKATTAYLAGDKVLSPGGDVVSAISNFTSGASFNAANWNYSTSYVSDQPGYDIFILAGQSNMAGTSTPALPNAAVTDPANSRISQWKTHGTTGIQPATDPLDMYDTPPLPQGIGPGLQFARWYVSRRPNSRRKVLLVPTAKGGSAVEGVSSPPGFTWKVGRVDVATNLYSNMVTQALAAKAAADAVAGSVNRFAGFLWLQGEADGNNNIPGSLYRTDLDVILNQVRTDLSAPTMPIIVGTMVPEYLNVGTRAAVDAAHRNTPFRIANSAVAVGPSAMNIGDSNHYSIAGQRALGKSFADAYEAVLQGLAPSANDYTPAQVTGVSTSALTTSLTPAWLPSANGTSYLVEYRAVGATPWTSAGSTSSTALTISGLTTGQAYEVRVTASNLFGDTASPSATVTGTPAAPPPPLVSDTFTRADSASSLGTATSGQTWSATGTWGISSNTAYNPGAVDNDRVIIDSGVSDQKVSVTITAGAGAANLAWGVMARMADASNGYYVTFTNTSNLARMFKIVAGVSTQIGSAYTYSPSMANGDIIGLTVVGSTLTAYLRGAAVLVVTDTTFTTGTKAGLRNGSASSSSSVIRYDDFKIETP